MKLSLVWRVAGGMALVFAVLGFALSVWMTASFAHVEEAVTQRANRGLAAELLARHLGADAPGSDLASIRDAFARYMGINPAIELYLLDREGRVMAWSSGPSRPVVRARVRLEPVQHFVGNDAAYPIRGDDPRDAGRQSIFSAAPVVRGGAAEGYLYVVLVGGAYQSIGDEVRRTQRHLQGVWVIAGAVSAAGVAAFGLLGVPLARLRRLARAVEGFRASGFATPLPPTASARGDEIDDLAAAFDAMSQRMVDQLDELRRADTVRRDLVANVSHDLRTPLASLRGYVDTLLIRRAQLSPEETRNYLEVLARQTDHLSRLVNELFDLGKLETGDTEIHAEPMHLGELVQDVVQKFQIAAGERGIALAAEIPPGLPLVRADIGLMERVLDNLIGNALRHTPGGGKVTIGLSRSGDGVRLDVADTGPGIASGDLPHIFDRFYRAEKSRNSALGGAGLGLAIVRRILDLHGAAIRVESAPGEGARFYFTLSAA